MHNQKIFSVIILILILALPLIGYCSVESSLAAVQTKLIGTILPLAAIIGLVFAGLSFVAGSPNARNHLILAIIGAAIGFGAPVLSVGFNPSFINFIRPSVLRVAFNILKVGVLINGIKGN